MYDSPIGEDGVLGPSWKAMLEALLTQLNGERGRLDGAVALERRRRITGKRWDQLTAESRQIALDFATGNLPNLLPGAVNWAGRNVSSGLPRVATPSDWNNYFYFSSPGSTGGSRAWAGANIVVEQAAGESRNPLFNRFLHFAPASSCRKTEAGATVEMTLGLFNRAIILHKLN